MWESVGSLAALALALGLYWLESARRRRKKKDADDEQIAERARQVSDASEQGRVAAMQRLAARDAVRRMQKRRRR